MRIKRSCTVQREPVVLGRRQRGQCTGLVLKHHRVWDDLITDCHLQSHQPCVMGYRETNRAKHAFVIRAIQSENHRSANESSASTSYAWFDRCTPKRLYEPSSIKTQVTLGTFGEQQLYDIHKMLIRNLALEEIHFLFSVRILYVCNWHLPGQ